MASTNSSVEPRPGPVIVPRLGQGTEAVKLLITGPFGVGKTTFVRTVSAIRPLVTEAPMTHLSEQADDCRGLPEKATTTVAIDFGRVDLADDLALYLFGSPGQERFSAGWELATRQALGALVLVDLRLDRLEKVFPVLERVEECDLAYTVGINRFADAPRVPHDEIREALDLDLSTPMVELDAREGRSSVGGLITLMKYVRGLS